MGLGLMPQDLKCQYLKGSVLPFQEGARPGYRIHRPHEVEDPGPKI
jgi:hypothetical protein